MEFSAVYITEMRPVLTPVSFSDQKLRNRHPAPGRLTFVTNGLCNADQDDGFDEGPSLHTRQTQTFACPWPFFGPLP